ncbi:hypothetical protein T07_1055 [Trichinella nelsoni]|uniref:Uncharacterized protein n=1 Tax=Trichinella nelsoni TaxID=6336 RepID=A0A0V0SAY0_9BILA|nr:hypothetical protein T07_1055 [Trichinella nelsoni]
MHSGCGRTWSSSTGRYGGGQIESCGASSSRNTGKPMDLCTHWAIGFGSNSRRRPNWRLTGTIRTKSRRSWTGTRAGWRRQRLVVHFDRLKPYHGRQQNAEMWGVEHKRRSTRRPTAPHEGGSGVADADCSNNCIGPDDKVEEG